MAHLVSEGNVFFDIYKAISSLFSFALPQDNVVYTVPKSQFQAKLAGYENLSIDIVLALMQILDRFERGNLRLYYDDQSHSYD